MVMAPARGLSRDCCRFSVSPASPGSVLPRRLQGTLGLALLQLGLVLVFPALALDNLWPHRGLALLLLMLGNGRLCQR